MKENLKLGFVKVRLLHAATRVYYWMYQEQLRDYSTIWFLFDLLTTIFN